MSALWLPWILLNLNAKKTKLLLVKNDKVNSTVISVYT